MAKVQESDFEIYQHSDSVIRKMMTDDFRSYVSKTGGNFTTETRIGPWNIDIKVSKAITQQIPD